MMCSLLLFSILVLTAVARQDLYIMELKRHMMAEGCSYKCESPCFKPGPIGKKGVLLVRYDELPVITVSKGDETERMEYQNFQGGQLVWAKSKLCNYVVFQLLDKTDGVDMMTVLGFTSPHYKRPQSGSYDTSREE